MCFYVYSLFYCKYIQWAFTTWCCHRHTLPYEGVFRAMCFATFPPQIDCVTFWPILTTAPFSHSFAESPVWLWGDLDHVRSKYLLCRGYYVSLHVFFLLAFIYLLIYFWRQGMFVCIAPLICRVKEKVLTAKTNEQVKKPQRSFSGAE